MPSIKDLKKRIGSVKNTQQTTRAMKMVSAAKLRRAQEAVLNHRPFAKQTWELLSELLKSGSPVSSPLFGKPEGEKKTLLVVLTSDRGLCGGFNGNVIRFTQKYLASHLASHQADLVFVGKRGYDFFKSSPVTIFRYFSELSGKVSFKKAQLLANALVEAYTTQYSEVVIIYNKFKNAASQEVVAELFLPFSPEQEEELNVKYLVKPGREELIQQLLLKNVETQIFRILLESQASEHGARMSAMENATKNAGEMIKKLALQYNKQRQAGITKELLEIISGSESQK